MNKESIQKVVETLENTFSSFNEKLFNNELEKPIIIVSPEVKKKNSITYGYCTSWRAWQKDGTDGYYEISISAEHLNRPLKESVGTLLHEMIHLYNLQNNIKDTSRGGTYHNKAFKETAEKFGLTVSKGDKYGYNITSLNETTSKMVEDMNITNFEIVRFQPDKVKKTKQSGRKYVCPVCGNSVRATKEVYIACMDCEVIMLQED